MGTLAALLHYHRHGRFPQQDAGTVSRGELARLWLRVIVGAIVAVAAIASLIAQGLLTM